jgi:hypothetical protein
MSKQEIVDALKKKSVKAMLVCKALAEYVVDADGVTDELSKEVQKVHKMSEDIYGKISIWEALGAPQ